ncbi:MAG: C39 family peptidase [Ardenticatenales bacterium]
MATISIGAVGCAPAAGTAVSTSGANPSAWSRSNAPSTSSRGTDRVTTMGSARAGDGGESTVVPPPLGTALAMDTAAARGDAFANATLARPTEADVVAAEPNTPVYRADSSLAQATSTAQASSEASAASASTAMDVDAATPALPVASAAANAAPPESPAAAAPGASSVQLPGIVHTWQKWNNCGPSSAVMALSAFGVRVDQLAAAAELKPDREDTNVAPDELAAFIRRQGLQAIMRYGADRDRLRALLRAGVPVIVEHWVSVEGRGEMGHYRVLTGYDDASAEFIAFDSYYGANRRYGYDAVEQMGRPFLGVYVPVYAPAQAAAVSAALGADGADDTMWSRVGAVVDGYNAAHADDPWAWFAQGEVRARRHDAAGAVTAFERARAIGLPFRAFWYQFGYGQALFESGKFDALIAIADETLASMHGENLEEWDVWRGRALHALGRNDEARAAYGRAIEFHAGYAPAVAAMAELP